MNQPKIHSYLLDLIDAIKLYNFFYAKKDFEACRRLTCYMRLLSEDLDRLIDSNHRPEDQQTDGEPRKGDDPTAAKSILAVGTFRYPKEAVV